jgi:hypothetical protein
MQKLQEASEQLLTTFTQQIIETETSNIDIIAKAEEAILISLDYLSQLTTFIEQYGFADQTEEIHIFKNIKPKFLQTLLYYTAVYNFHAIFLKCVRTSQRELLVLTLIKLKQLSTGSHPIYDYYQTKRAHLDDQYFVRSAADIGLIPDSFFYVKDPASGTGYDFILSLILANNRFITYLENLIGSLYN